MFGVPVLPVPPEGGGPCSAGVRERELAAVPHPGDEGMGRVAVQRKWLAQAAVAQIDHDLEQLDGQRQALIRLDAEARQRDDLRLLPTPTDQCRRDGAIRMSR